MRVQLIRDFGSQFGHVGLQLRLQLGKVRFGGEVTNLAQAVGERFGRVRRLSLRDPGRLSLRASFSVSKVIVAMTDNVPPLRPDFGRAVTCSLDGAERNPGDAGVVPELRNHCSSRMPLRSMRATGLAAKASFGGNRFARSAFPQADTSLQKFTDIFA